jgi:anti-sigma regulatory factor (Ser/Thr protein kinase)
MRTKRFPGKYESLVKISEFVVQAASDAGLDEYGAYSVELAVDEACTNIIEHAYGGEGKGEISISTEIVKEGLVVSLHDWGIPFNPGKLPMPKIGAKLKDVKPRGAGVYLIRKLMDKVEYEFGPNGNILTLTKNKKGDA